MIRWLLLRSGFADETFLHALSCPGCFAKMQAEALAGMALAPNDEV